MKTFAPLIIFFVAVIVIVVAGMLYEGRWRERRVRRDYIEERRRARSEYTRSSDTAEAAGDAES